MATSLEREIITMLIRRKGIKACLQVGAEVLEEIAVDIEWQNKPRAARLMRQAKAVRKCANGAAFVE